MIAIINTANQVDLTIYSTHTQSHTLTFIIMMDCIKTHLFNEYVQYFDFEDRICVDLRTKYIMMITIPTLQTMITTIGRNILYSICKRKCLLQIAYYLSIGDNGRNKCLFCVYFVCFFLCVYFVCVSVRWLSKYKEYKPRKVISPFHLHKHE